MIRWICLWAQTWILSSRRKLRRSITKSSRTIAKWTSLLSSWAIWTTEMPWLAISTSLKPKSLAIITKLPVRASLRQLLAAWPRKSVSKSSKEPVKPRRLKKSREKKASCKRFLMMTQRSPNSTRKHSLKRKTSKKRTFSVLKMCMPDSINSLISDSCGTRLRIKDITCLERSQTPKMRLGLPILKLMWPPSILIFIGNTNFCKQMWKRTKNISMSS